MSAGTPAGGDAPPAAEPGNPDPAAGETARRPLNLSILLAAILALNAIGLARGLATRGDLMRAIPNFTPLLFQFWSGAQALAVLGAIGLWGLKRWGLYLLAASWAIAAFVDIRLGATGHAILVTGLFWLVVLFVRPVRSELR